MAKKKKLELSDLSFDDDLSFPDFDGDFDVPEMKDDRKPVTKFTHGFLSGAKETVLSDSFARRFVKDALPKGYGQVYDLAGESTRTIRDLYNTSTKELKPLLKDIKRSTGRIIPMTEGFLPESITKRLKEFSKVDDTSNSKQDWNEAQIQNTLADIFKTQTEQRKEDQDRDDVKENVRENIEQKRHLDQLGQLDAIRNAVVQLSQYQNNIGINFQRKSLEIQYRHYFIAQEALEENKKQTAQFGQVLEGIAKNTALPDFLKLRGTERFKEVMRNKFMDNIQGGIFDQRRNFVRDITKRVSDTVTSKVKDFADNVRTALMAADTMADMHEMQKDMGGGMNPAEMAGSVVGGQVADNLGKKIGKAIRKPLEKNIPGLIKGGNESAHFVENLPQLASEWGKGEREGKFEKYIPNWLLDFGRDMVNGLPRENNSLEIDGLRGLQEPASFTRQANKSITEIIPGFLSRIHREIKILRTGDTKTELVSYDYTRNQFDKESSINKNIFESIFDKYEIESTKEQSESLVDQVDKNKKLTPEQRKILADHLLKSNMRNEVGDAKNLTDDFKYRGEAGKHSDTFAQLFEEYFKDDKNSDKKVSFAREFSRLGDRMGDKRELIQNYANAGQLGMLIKAGIISKDGSRIDPVGMQEYFNGKEYSADAEFEDGNVNTFNKPKGKKKKPKNKSETEVVENTSLTSNITNVTERIGNRIETVIKSLMGFDTKGKKKGSSTNASSIRFDSKEIIDAIKENSSKSVTEVMSETLLRIEKQLEAGINTNGTGVPGNKSFMNKTLGEHFNSVWNLGTKAAKGIGRFGNGIVDQAWKFGKRGLDAGKDLLKWGKNKFTEINDVYIKGELEPRLLAWKLKAGHYRDQATGKVIKTFKDIKGAVVDENGNIVLDAESWKKAYARIPGGQKLLSALGSTWKFAKGIFGNIKNGLTGAYGFALDAGTRLAKAAWDLTDRAEDVYVKGNTEPSLLAITMRAGGYFSETTGKPVTKISEIDGPIFQIIDGKKEYVLTKENIAKGLVDANGKPIRHGLGKILGIAKDFAKGAINKVLNFGSKIGGMFGGLGDFFKGWFDGKGLVFSGSKEMITQLEAIREILDDRLPYSNKKRKYKGKSNSTNSTNDSEPTQESTFKKLDTEALRKSFKETAAKGKLLAKEKLAEAKAKVEQSKKDGLLNKTMTKLLAFFDKKKLAGDSDGDGVRDGSVFDLRKKKEAAAAKLAASKDKVKNATSGFSLESLKGLFSKFGKKDEEEDDGLDIDVDGGSDSKDKKAKRKPKVKPKAKGFWGKAGRGAKAVGKGAWGLTKGVGRLGMNALTGGVGGPLGMAMNVGRAALPLAGTLVSGAASAAGAIGTGAMALGGMAGTALGAVGAVLASPVVLGALAVGALGAGAYFGYKYITRNKLEPLSKVRYVQYGFKADKNENVSKVFELEDSLKDAISFSGGVAKLDEKKIDTKKILDIFGIEIKDQNATNKFLLWFTKRFKPFFLVHVSALNKVKQGTALADVDSKLKGKEKKDYLEIAKYPEGPYDVMDSPIPNEDSLQAGKSDAEKVIKEAEEAINKEMGEVGKDKGAKGAAAVAATVAAGTKAGEPVGMKAQANKAKLDTASDTTNLKPTIVGNTIKNDLTNSNKAGFGGDRGLIYVAATAAPLNQTFNGRVDALTAIRFKTYGLKEMDADKVRALSRLEELVKTNVKTNPKGQAEWKGSADEIVNSSAAAFGVTPNGDGSGMWLSWFKNRFLVVYLNYVTALISKTGKKDPNVADASLKPADSVDVATIIVNSSIDGKSVWLITETPWPGYELNASVSSTDGNMKGIKEESKKDALPEANGSGQTKPPGSDKQKAAIGSKTGSNQGADQEATKQQAEEKQSFWSKAKEAISDAATSVSNKASRAWGATKEFFGYDGGYTVTHKGNGTGGDINALPNPKGDGSYAAYKDLIDAVAKMTGSDPNLLATMAAIESGFKGTVKADTSSATGLFQFISSTWKTMLKKYASKYGISPDTPATDPKANALMGAEFIKENAQALNGIKPNLTDTDMYLAHFLGAGGAKKFLKSDPNAIAAQNMSSAANANKPIFFEDNGKGRPRTFGEVYQEINRRVRSRGKQFGLDSALASMGSEAIKSTNGTTQASNSAPATAQKATANTQATAQKAQASVEKKLPIANQAPSIAPASGSGSATVVNNKAQPTPQTNNLSDNGGFNPSTMSAKSKDINLQTQAKQNAVSDSIGVLDGTLQKSLAEHQAHTQILGKILSAIINMNGSSSQSKQATTTETETTTVTKPTRTSGNSSVTAPVSVAKPY